VLFAAVFLYFIVLILRSRISPEKEKFVNGKRLKLLRKEKKYSAKHMADLLGINRRDYRYIEKGFYVKDIAHIDKIKDILGVSANELKKT
jgi:transcriptional regulator with XRE-family HTH domain